MVRRNRLDRSASAISSSVVPFPFKNSIRSRHHLWNDFSLSEFCVAVSAQPPASRSSEEMQQARRFG
jgi:hypothetical protein